MAQITLNSTGVASNGALVLQSNGTTTAVTVSTGQVATFANDAVVQGLTVGRGSGAVASNTAFGTNALASNSTGTDVTAIGNEAYRYGTAINNTAFGSKALGSAVVTGTENTALGRAALFVNTSGSSNIAVGSTTLFANTTGSANAGFGHEALRNNTTASNNTAVGYQAGYTNVTGAANTFLGQTAGYSTTSAQNTMLGAGSGYSTTGAGNTFVGYTAGYNVSTGAKNTIIGQYNGNQNGLDIRTSSGYVVLSDGDGNPLVKVQNNASLALQDAGVVGGIGISFPATQSASSDANTLDDYEEGTFTPSCVCSGQTITLGTAIGTYTKIGNVVRAQIAIVISTVTGTAGGNTTIAGFPFSHGDTTYTGQGAIGYNDGFASTINGTWMSSTNMLFRSGTRSSGNDGSGFTAGGYIFISVVYRA